MDTSNEHPPSCLDNDHSRAYTADYAASTGLSTDEALDATRKVDLDRPETSVDLCAAKNRFKLAAVSKNEFGISVVIKSPGIEDMVEKAPFSI